MLVQPVREAIIGNDGGDRGEQADGGGEQGLRNARRDHGERAVLLGRDGGEAAHDAPDRAEQPDKRGDRPGGGKEVQTLGQFVDFMRDGGVHNRTQALARALPVDPLAAGRMAPFRHRARQNLCDRQLVLGARLDEAVNVLGLPELAFEFLRLAADAAHAHDEGDDDRPGPDAGQDKADNHGFDYDIGLQKQPDRRKTGGGHRGGGEERKGGQISALPKDRCRPLAPHIWQANPSVAGWDGPKAKRMRRSRSPRTATDRP